MVKDKNQFDYEEHAGRNSVLLSTMSNGRNDLKTVLLTRKEDGRQVTVNANRHDPAFRHYTAPKTEKHIHGGFEVDPKDLDVIDTPAFKQNPEVEAANQRADAAEKSAQAAQAAVKELTEKMNAFLSGQNTEKKPRGRPKGSGGKSDENEPEETEIE
jgi:hypothetical protein